ncbi:MAG: hypothetical protein QW596_04485 [Sulfolobales archaeon]
MAKVTPVTVFMSSLISEIIVAVTKFVIKDPLGMVSGLWGLTVFTIHSY